MMMQSSVSESLFSGDPFFEGTRILWPLRRSALSEMRDDFVQRRSALVDSFLKDFAEGFHYDFLKGAALPSSLGLLGSPKKDEGLKAIQQGNLELSLDVREFSLEDITVKLVGRQLGIVAMKQTEAGDGASQGKRKGFIQKIDLPEHIDLSALSCSLTTEGRLKIEAPALAQSSTEERTVPIRFRTSLNIPISNNKKEEDKSSEKAT